MQEVPSIPPHAAILAPEAAWSLLAREIVPLSPVTVPRAEALGHLLAHDLNATVDVPAADVSAMDGYVVGHDALAGSALKVVSTLAAGQDPNFHLPRGTAAKIMTGAVVPSGGDRVVPVEQAHLQPAQSCYLLAGPGPREGLTPNPETAPEVTFQVAPQPGDHIRRRGEIIQRGQPLLPAGSLLTPGALALLATHGYREVPVIARPEVAVLSTGNEVVPPEVEPGPGQLRDSNTSFLLAAGATLGLTFRSLGIARDDPGLLRERVAAGLAADVLLLCGGVSAGDFDFVEDVLAGLGCRKLFDQVAIQPGKPLVAAVQAKAAGGQRVVLGLPGNPASVMVTFWLFARPLLRCLMGLADGFWHGALTAELTHALPGTKGRERYLPADVHYADGKLLATPHLPQGSHDLMAFSRGTALLRIPAHAAPTPPGGSCSILPLVHWPQTR